MKADIVRIKMPFMYGWIFREKEVPFLFRIMTLELTCDYLGVDFGEIMSGDNSDQDINMALLWNGYLAACMADYKKPKYKESHAYIWDQNMSKESRKSFLQQISILTDALRKGGEESGDEVKKK